MTHYSSIHSSYTGSKKHFGQFSNLPTSSAFAKDVWRFKTRSNAIWSWFHIACYGISHWACYKSGINYGKTTSRGRIISGKTHTSSNLCRIVYLQYEWGRTWLIVSKQHNQPSCTTTLCQWPYFNPAAFQSEIASATRTSRRSIIPPW